MERSFLRTYLQPILLGAALLVATGIKLWLIAANALPFNADEAVVALMARHILQGDLPVFFYGQAYMGSLDALLVAGGFALFGQAVWVIRLVQLLLYLGTLLSLYALGRMVFRSPWVGLAAVWLLAIPTVNLSLYTSVSLGGYGEALLLGNLILLCGLQLGRALAAGRPGRGRLWLALGFLAGLGLWAFGLTLVYSLPVAAYLLLRLGTGLRRHELPRRTAFIVLLLAGLGLLLGAAPWWLYAVQHGPGLLLAELSGSAIAGVEHMPWLLRVGQHLWSLVLLGGTVTFGLRPPWSIDWLALPLLPFALMFWMLVLGHTGHRLAQSARAPASGHPDPAEMWVVAGVGLTLALAFLFSSFGADPSGRYFVPLAIPLALFAGDLLLTIHRRMPAAAWGLLALVLVYQFAGTWQVVRRNPPGLTTQFYGPTQVDHRYDGELLDFLRAQGEYYGYGNYWVTYPLAFLSSEELIFVPRLPYHLDFRYTPRDDRYTPYDDRVAKSERVAYITTNHAALDDYLRAQFDELGVRYLERQIGSYHVFYALSRPVRPLEVGLGLERAEGLP